MTRSSRPNASPVLTASLAERLEQLTGRAPSPVLLEVAVELVALGGGHAHLARPSDWSALRAVEAEAKRPTPYWAVPWPSGLALAHAIAADPPRGLRVLELGCGLGLPSIAAAMGGATQVLATDGAPEAVVFAAHNLALNELEADTALVDWAAHGDALAPQAWDLVLAADVLYTRANVEALVRLLPRLLAPDGEAVIADPRRSGADELLPIAKKLWRVETREAEGEDRVLLHRLRSRLGSG